MSTAALGEPLDVVAPSEAVKLSLLDEAAVQSAQYHRRPLLLKQTPISGGRHAAFAVGTAG